MMQVATKERIDLFGMLWDIRNNSIEASSPEDAMKFVDRATSLLGQIDALLKLLVGLDVPEVAEVMCQDVLDSVTSSKDEDGCPLNPESFWLFVQNKFDLLVDVDALLNRLDSLGIEPVEDLLCSENLIL